MGDLILIAVMAAVFILCYFVMKKVDDFLDNRRKLLSNLEEPPQTHRKNNSNTV